MIERLTAQFAKYETSATVRRRFLEHLEKERLREVERAASGEEHAPRCEDAHRAQVDLLVAAHGGGQCGPRLCESGRIEHDRLEARAVALARLEILERIRLDELTVRQRISPEVLLGAHECVRARVECDDVLRAAGEM